MWILSHAKASKIPHESLSAAGALGGRRWERAGASVVRGSFAWLSPGFNYKDVSSRLFPLQLVLCACDASILYGYWFESRLFYF